MPVKYEVSPKRVTLAAARRAAKKVKQENAVKRGAKKTVTKKKPVTAKVIKPAIKVKWIAALKSGKYPKAKSALKSQNGYCCLGVLCDMYAKSKRDGSKFVPHTSDFFPTPPDGDMDFVVAGSDEKESCYLPDSVAQWAGLPTLGTVPADSEEDHQRALADLNDNSDDFSDVIKYITNTL